VVQAPVPPVMMAPAPLAVAASVEGWLGASVVPEGVIQRDDVLLVGGTQGAHADVERTVLPDHIVGQQRVRDTLASPAEECALSMARGHKDGQRCRGFVSRTALCFMVTTPAG